MVRYMMTIASALLIGWTVFPPVVQAQVVQAQAICGEHGEVVSKLEKGHSETPVSMGLASNGAVIEVFASDAGTFTIIMTLPSGMSCLMAAGEDWQDVPKQSVGAKI